MATREQIIKEIIFNEACRAFSVMRYDIVSPARFRERCYARNVIMYFLRFKLAMRYSRIAEIVGRANHTTAIHGIKQVKKLKDKDQSFNEKFKGVREAINARLNSAGL